MRRVDALIVAEHELRLGHAELALAWMALADRCPRDWTLEQEREWVTGKPTSIMPTDPEWPGKLQD